MIGFRQLQSVIPILFNNVLGHVWQEVSIGNGGVWLDCNQCAPNQSGNRIHGDIVPVICMFDSSCCFAYEFLDWPELERFEERGSFRIFKVFVPMTSKCPGHQCR